jgi:hypothetical protein
VLGLRMQHRKAIFLLLLLVGIILSSIFNNTLIGRSASIEEVEIRDYEGEDLSSINDFRENSIKGPQYIDIESYILSVKGLVANELELTYDEIINNYQLHKKVVTLNCVEGWSVTILWEGIRLRDLFEEAGVDFEASVVIFHAYDGYSTSLPVDYIYDHNIIMAYKMNNITIPPERGFPFMLVAETKWGYKWIKWITDISISDDENFRGYWEQRGYPNNAEIPEFPPWIILPLFMIATLLAVTIYRKRLKKLESHNTHSKTRCLPRKRITNPAFFEKFSGQC